MNSLDAFDRKILAIIQEDATRSYADIGASVNLSASATLRRVQRMKDNGVIVATRAILAPDAVGQNLTIILEVMLQNEDADWGGGAARQALIDDPRVQQCHFVTGESDLFLLLSVASMADFKDFADRHFLHNTRIKKYRTSVVLERIKSTTVLPI
jgi:Lrp/AsnC family transcriptional regulator, leucine-responsive regulatory protein